MVHAKCGQLCQTGYLIHDAVMFENSAIYQPRKPETGTAKRRTAANVQQRNAGVIAMSPINSCRVWTPSVQRHGVAFDEVFVDGESQTRTIGNLDHAVTYRKLLLDQIVQQWVCAQ